MVCEWCGSFTGSTPHVLVAQHLHASGRADTLFRARLCVRCGDKLADALRDTHDMAKAIASAQLPPAAA